MPKVGAVEGEVEVADARDLPKWERLGIEVIVYKAKEGG